MDKNQLSPLKYLFTSPLKAPAMSRRTHHDVMDISPSKAASSSSSSGKENRVDMQMPATPGRMAALKSIVIQACDAEAAGRNEDALAALMQALKLMPGEPRLLARVAKVEARLRPARRALEDSNDASDADLLHASMQGVVMSSSVRKARRGGAAATSSYGGSSSGGGVEPCFPSAALSNEERDDDNEAMADASMCEGDGGDTSSTASAPAASSAAAVVVTAAAAAAAAVAVAATAESPPSPAAWGAAAPESAGADEWAGTNSEIRAALEGQIVGLLNTASPEKLMGLHGVGIVRAERVAAARRAHPFAHLEDLQRIGMHKKQIERLARQNMLEQLDLP